MPDNSTRGILSRPTSLPFLQPRPRTPVAGLRMGCPFQFGFLDAFPHFNGGPYRVVRRVSRTRHAGLPALVHRPDGGMSDQSAERYHRSPTPLPCLAASSKGRSCPGQSPTSRSSRTGKGEAFQSQRSAVSRQLSPLRPHLKHVLLRHRAGHLLPMARGLVLHPGLASGSFSDCHWLTLALRHRLERDHVGSSYLWTGRSLSMDLAQMGPWYRPKVGLKAPTIDPPSMKTRFLLFFFLAVLTLLRWAWHASQELSPTEAYLATCGTVLSWATFEGPAGTALAVATGMQLVGPSSLGATIFWPLFAVGATLALYYLILPLAGEKAALTGAVLLNLLPNFNEAALTPNSAMPLAMFSLGFMACAWRGLDRLSSLWWVAGGFCAAGGLAFNYLACFLLPAMTAVLISSPRWRRQLLKPGIWLALIPSLALGGLLLAWNANHGWVHFIGGTFQTAITFDWAHLPYGIWDSTMAVSPLVLPLLGAAIFFALRQIGSSPKIKFLIIPSLSFLLITTYLLLRGESSPAAALLTTALLVPALAWIPLSSQPHLLSLVMLSAAVWSGAELALQPKLIPLVTPAVAAEISNLRQKQTINADAPVFLIAENARLASAIGLHLKETSFVPVGHPPVYVVESPFAQSQYALWPRYDQIVEAPENDPEALPDPYTEEMGINPFILRSALYLTTERTEQLPQAITAAFAGHRLLAKIAAPSGESLFIYLCSEYETLPL